MGAEGAQVDPDAEGAPVAAEAAMVLLLALRKVTMIKLYSLF